MSNKCRVEDWKTLMPCAHLEETIEHVNPRGKSKGVAFWVLSKNGKTSRTFCGVKSGSHVDKGIVFNYCPFCGENISSMFEDQQEDTNNETD